MAVKMTDEQLGFWRELLAPFADHELSVKKISGRDFTYIDKRSLANRLDSVVGPDGWYTEYRDEGGRGLVCRLHLCVPTGPNGSRVFMFKEEGGADEGMTKKVGGGSEEDVDNNFKSEFTNAFRRAAQDAWGIGRYLYQKGIPSFLDPNASAPAPGHAAQPAHAPRATPPSPPQSPVPHSAAPAATPNYGNSPAQSQAVTPPQGQRTFDNFKIPRPGKSVFAWAKEMEKTFETRLLDGMNADAAEYGFPKVFADWTEDQVNAVAMNVIRHIKTLPTYKGQFDHMNTGPDSGIDTSPGDVRPGVTVDNIVQPNLSDLRKTLMDLMQEHVVKSIGRKAEASELKAAFGQIAANCKNGAGNMGEIPESLSGLIDVIWLENMIAFVRDQIRNTVQSQVPATGDQIPF